MHDDRRRSAAILAMQLAITLATWTFVFAEEPRQSTVGIPVRIEGLVIDGPQLEALPWDDRRAPVLVRIVETYPHGTAFRYDIEYHGLEAGDFDLRDYLQRTTGGPIDDVPAIPVRVMSVLPPGQIIPRDLEQGRLPAIGGYRQLAMVLGAIWVLGLIALLWKRRKPDLDSNTGRQQLTLADRLQPMVQAAVAGHLEPAQRAELERLLLSYWRRKLDLEDKRPTDAMVELRQHAEAGQLLRQLEDWLHRPDPPEAVDIAELLEPYRQLPNEEPAQAESDSPAGPHQNLVQSRSAT